MATYKRWAIGVFDTGSGDDTQELLTVSASTAVVISSLIISNYSGDTDANVVFEHLDSTTALLQKFSLSIPADLSPLVIDSSFVLEAADVINITSNINNLSVIVSGEEVAVT